MVMVWMIDTLGGFLVELQYIDLTDQMTAMVAYFLGWSFRIRTVLIADGQ